MPAAQTGVLVAGATVDHAATAKPDNCIRLITANVQTALSSVSYGDRGRDMLQLAVASDFDLLLLQDTGTKPEDSGQRAAQVKRAVGKGCTAAQLPPHIDGDHRVGGLLQAASGALAPRAAGVTDDARGWNRYDIVKYRGRQRRTLHVINAYFPFRRSTSEVQDGHSMQAQLTRLACDERRATTGEDGKRAKRSLRTGTSAITEAEVADPVKLMLADIGRQMQGVSEDPDATIILAGDTNINALESGAGQNDLAALLRTLGLLEIAAASDVRTTWPSRKRMAAGGTRVDRVFISARHITSVERYQVVEQTE